MQFNIVQVQRSAVSLGENRRLLSSQRASSIRVYAAKGFGTAPKKSAGDGELPPFKGENGSKVSLFARKSEDKCVTC